MNKTNLIIFSKDRACQLHSLLFSMQQHWKDFYDQEIYVIYTYSNEKYKKGYDLLIGLMPKNVKFILQTDFKKDVIDSIKIDTEFTIFGVDDNIFVDSFDLQDDIVNRFKESYQCHCVSLRLDKYKDYCFTENKKMLLPLIVNNKFEWNYFKNNGDWSYPMSLDFHLFKTYDIYSLLLNLNYSSPNTLEGQLAKYPLNKPYMMCYDKAKIVNLVMNKVQTDNNNRTGEKVWTAEELNDNYLTNPMPLLYIKKNTTNSCHITLKD